MFNAIQRGSNQLCDVYVCLSTDVKPSDCHNGDVLLELDTGKVYLFDVDGGAWLQFGGQSNA